KEYHRLPLPESRVVLGLRPGQDSNLERFLGRRSRVAPERSVDGCLRNRRAVLLVLKDIGRHNQAERAIGPVSIRTPSLFRQKRRTLIRYPKIRSRLFSGSAAQLEYFWEHCCTL